MGGKAGTNCRSEGRIGAMRQGCATQEMGGEAKGSEGRGMPFLDWGHHNSWGGLNTNQIIVEDSGSP
jgi:hypothetical protein